LLEAPEGEKGVVKERSPVISVIIPTHNRKADLERTLEALKVQTYPLAEVEVIIVSDGSQDGTLEMLKDYRAPFRLHVIAQSNLGPAAARNCGACSATAPLLLFLDDDVEPAPALIEAHVCAHQGQKDHVVIGPYMPVYQDNSYFHIQIRSWWEGVFRSMLQRGHRFSFKDLLTGNMSIKAELFARFGGFNPDLKAHEDYEFGMRLIKANVPITAAADAMGLHHDKINLSRSLRRKFEEGSADLIMARLHPEFSQALPLAQTDLSRLSPKLIMCMLVFNWPTAGDVFAVVLRVALDLMEKARLRCSWRQLSTILHKYWYWRGIIYQSETLQKLREILEKGAVSSGPSASLTELDLSNGLEHAEHRLDEERPGAVRICFESTPIGIIHHQPGAEALRGIHLRSLLSDSLAGPLLHAMALEGKIIGSKTVDRLKLSKSIRARARWFGPIRPGEMWFEQYQQWSELQKKDSDKELALKEHRDKLLSLEYETAWLEKRRLNWKAIDGRVSRMKRLMGYWVIDCFALWIAIQLVPGIHSTEGFIKLLLTVFLFGTMNVFIRPLSGLLSFPLFVITAGPLLLLLNALLILFCATLADPLGLGFAVEGLGSASTGAVTVIVACLLITEFARRGRKKLAFRKERSWMQKLEKRRIRLEGQIVNAKNAAERGEQSMQEQKLLADVVKNKIAPQLSAEE
jgi:glycosyltransferase involved in cell wall biosynthesis/uncharacterized membrane protein YvlD (DUF360 family)